MHMVPIEGGCNMEQYSRKAFVTGAALGMGALAVAGCGSWAKGDEAAGWAGFAPGVYTYDAMGHNAPFTISCTFTKYALSAIDTPNNQETIGVGKVALNELPSEIIRSQSLIVDVLTGASITSAVLLSGVRDCAERAGGTSELDATEGPADDTNESYEADVCVIGAGGAGLAAAIAAVQTGATVVVLEKCGIDGGSTNVSEGALNAVDPERQSKQGIDDSIDTFYTSTFEGGHSTGTPQLVKYLVDGALDSVKWLEHLGVRFKDEIGAATGSLGQRSHYPYTPSGNTYIRSFIDYVNSHSDKISVLNETDVTNLIIKDGVVIGAQGVHKGNSPVTVNAKSVIIATGGFGANVEYRQQVNTGVWKDVVLDSTIGCTNINPCAQGEGLKLAESAGAQLINLADIQLHPCGTPGTGLMEDIRTSGRNRIFVNKTGKRFVNEGAARDTLCKAIFAQPDSTYWIVVNKLRYPDTTTPDANGATINNMIATGHVLAGDTIEELAMATGMDASKLQASIDDYNAVVAGKKDDELGFKADNSADKQMTEGPWYACRKVPTVHHTMGGVRINVRGQALDDKGDPIPGLYAAGEVTGGIHGENRLGGNAIADCFTFGRSAGVHAAMNAGYDEPAPAEDGSSPVGGISFAEAEAESEEIPAIADSAKGDN